MVCFIFYALKYITRASILKFNENFRSFIAPFMPA